MLKKNCLSFYSVIFLVCLFSASAFAFGGGAMSDEAPEEVVITEEMKQVTVPLRNIETGETEEVDLFSRDKRNLPVASVNGEAITLEDFARELASMHGTMGAEGDSGKEASGEIDFARMLDRLVSIKLIKQEALNIGFDRKPEFQRQLDRFTKKTMIQLLLARQVENLDIAEEEVDTLYKDMAIEAHLKTYHFKEQAAAQSLLDQVDEGMDFEAAAEQMVADDKAEGGGDEVEYVKLTDLLPNVAKAVYEMDNQAVSPVFSTEEGFFVFELMDKRIYEDPEIRQTARQRLLKKKEEETKREYLSTLIDDNVTFNETVLETLDFQKIAEQNPDVILADVLTDLREDKRVVASIEEKDLQMEISVADIARKIEEGLFHGTDKKLDPASLNNKRTKLIKNLLTEALGQMAAKRQKIDQSPEFKKAVEKKKEEMLFDYFVSKAVIPGIKVMEKEAREYYYNHLEDYSSPLMLKMKSLVFTDEAAAKEAYKKLQAGNDFQWVSANSRSQADPDNKDILALGGTLLARSALPEGLQDQVSGARPGDSFLYSGPGDLHYALMVEKSFPPKAETFQEVREKVGGILYGQKIKAALDEYVERLKEAYETEIYIVPENQQS